MPGTLTFVIPVRHHKSIDDWQAVQDRLAVTVASVCAQELNNWQCAVVANEDSQLPNLPDAVSVVRVNLPYTPLPNSGPAGWTERRNEAVRADKGQRVLAGLIATQPTGHVMVVDYDDLVSRHLSSFPAAQPSANGWFIESGYAFDDGLFALRLSAFDESCGTSLLIHSRLLEIPAAVEEADPVKVSRWLGSHRFSKGDFAAAGTPLAPIGFPGAMYRVGYRGNTSGTPSVYRKYLINRQMLKRPRRLVALAARLRLTRRVIRSFQPSG